MKGCTRTDCAAVAHCMVPENCGFTPPEPVSLQSLVDPDAYERFVNAGIVAPYLESLHGLQAATGTRGSAARIEGETDAQYATRVTQGSRHTPYAPPVDVVRDCCLTHCDEPHMPECGYGSDADL